LALLSTGLGPRDIKLSADHSLLAIASAAGVHLYDPKTLYRLAFFAANSEFGIVRSVAISSDGKLVATGDNSGTLEVWDVKNRQLLYNFVDGHRGVQSLVFSPDYRKLVTGGRDGRIKVWDMETGSLIRTMQRGGDIYQVIFSPDGHWIFTASDDTTIRMIEIETGNIVNTFFDTWTVNAMALSADGKLLASGNSIWDVPSGEKLHSLPFGSVGGLDFLRDGKQLAISTKEQIIIVDAKSGEELHRLDSSTGLLTFLPDDNRLLSGSSFDGTVKIWDLDSGKLLQEWNLGERGVLDVAFSPDGTRAAAGLWYDVTAIIWDVYNGQLLQTFSEDYQGTNCDGVRELAFSPDSSRIITAAGCNFKIVRAWNAESGEPLQVLDDRGSAHIASSADGRFLAWSVWEKVVLWDVMNQQELRTWNPQPNARFFGIEFSPDSSLLATFSWESRNLQLWDVESGKLIRKFGDYSTGIASAVFSPDGNLLAVGSKNRAQIWEIETGKSMQIFRVPDESAHDLAFSPSGDILATAGGVSLFENVNTKFWQIRFWQVETGDLLYTIIVPASSLWPPSLAFSPDGRLLLTGSSEDGTVRLWGVLP
jgi:WD40 repeat protein